MNEYIESAISFASRIKRPTVLVGILGWFVSFWFNVLFIAPMLVGDTAVHITSRIASGETGLLALFIPNLIAAAILAYAISFFEVNGRAHWQDSMAARVEMFVAYGLGTATNYLGMLTFAKPDDPWYYVIGRILAAIAFEYFPERMFESALSNGENKGEARPQPFKSQQRVLYDVEEAAVESAAPHPNTRNVKCRRKFGDGGSCGNDALPSKEYCARHLPQTQTSSRAQ